MDKIFLMGNNDGLTRSTSDGNQPTYISPDLRIRLMMAAMKKACEFYSDFFDKSVSNLNCNELIYEYEHVLSHALSLGLFKEGGIRGKDHLSLWCLGHVLSPEIYVESGVFIGSSLHAFLESPGIKKIIAIDPNISRLKIPEEQIPGAELIDDKDFSQVKIDFSGKEALVYFDDHINTADRIFQASKKGFRYVLFDDSTGLEGICQRLYPPIPTIPMIMNSEIWSIGEELTWSFNRPSTTSLKNIIKGIIWRKINPGGTRISLTITQEMIDKCIEARKLIKKCNKLPDLGTFIPQSHPERMVDTSKFLVELNPV